MHKKQGRLYMLQQIQELPFYQQVVEPALTFAWMLMLAIWGGIAGYIRKVKLGIAPRFSIVELIGEIVVSGFVGIITLYLCQAAEFDIYLSAALVGISGHFGSRAVFVIEQLLQKKAGVLIKIETKDSPQDGNKTS